MKTVIKYNKLKAEITKTQDELNELIEKKNFNLLDKEVISLSEKIDKLLVEFVM